MRAYACVARRVCKQPNDALLQTRQDSVYVLSPTYHVSKYSNEWRTCAWGVEKSWGLRDRRAVVPSVNWSKHFALNTIKTKMLTLKLESACFQHGYSVSNAEPHITFLSKKKKGGPDTDHPQRHHLHWARATPSAPATPEARIPSGGRTPLRGCGCRPWRARGASPRQSRHGTCP